MSESSSQQFPSEDSKVTSPSKHPTQQARECKDRGNGLYGKRQFLKAIEAYQKGIDTLTAAAIEDPDLINALRSNMAMTWIKLKDFDKAISECTLVLESNPVGKVYYRRAIAREEKTFTANISAEEHRQQVLLAIDDLKKCLKIYENQEETSEIKKQRQQAHSALERLVRSYSTPSDPQEKNEMKSKMRESKSLGSPPVSSTSSGSIDASQGNGEWNNDPTAKKQPRPSQQHQKQDVMRLLMARKSAPPHGEAFFLIDWKWWRKWCQSVDFFYSSENDSAKAQRVATLLPKGAVIPQVRAEKEDDSDDSSASDDDDDDALGPIDNSRLFLNPSNIFYQHWYLNSELSSKPIPEALMPNLVRGWHYEILPREVYSALRSWYGESTPSICRRTHTNGYITLYDGGEKKNGATHAGAKKKKVFRCSACRAPHVNSRCKRCMSVQYCDRQCQEAHWPFHKVMCKQLASNGTNIVDANNTVDGKVGLHNLGNTCYMNSSLQALSHATPLARQFLSNKFKADINTSNPLGTGGKLASAYDSLMKEIWMRNKGHSFSPTHLKRAVAMFAPRFAGCLQHDAQEFLAYLLDGLHEDLNRIRKAPYVEMPDIPDGQNMTIAGAEAWDAHKRRNDSLVLDTFYGQFQSTCICPQCDRVSVSFDTFNHVSLEIPQLRETTVNIPVLVFRRPTGSGSNPPPIRYGFTMNRQSLVADLRQAVSQASGIPAANLTMAEIYENTVYDLLKSDKSLATMRSDDIIVAYENILQSHNNIHVIANQLIFVQDPSGRKGFARIGFPIITSMPTDVTCRGAWEIIWNYVCHFVKEEGSTDEFVDANNMYRPQDILTIQVLTKQGQPAPIFCTEDGKTTSQMPFDADEKLQNALGNEGNDAFLFFSLKWKNPMHPAAVEDDDDEDGSEKTQSEPPILIRPNDFLAFEEDSSLLRLVEQQRGKKRSKSVSLDQCLAAFTKPERLDENNTWYCSKCKDHVRAMKTMKLWRLPNILVVHLKRFEFKHSLRRDKLDTPVDFPLEGLDMSPHWSGQREMQNSDDIVDAKIDATYDLFAVVNHYGRMGFGHYTAFCRQWDEETISSQWHLFDDSSVRPVDGSEVVSQAAYVLFYKRRRFH